jgi:hypothetical protein
MDGVDEAISELDAFCYEKDPELMTWLKERVALMEFDLILEKLDSPQ